MNHAIGELASQSARGIASRDEQCAVRDVSKMLGGVPVLRDISISIAAGEFAVLVGPSGCGKSTLLRVVAGLEEPDSGSVFIGGRDVTNASPRDRDVAMVFQSYALYPHLTVRENLAFGLKLRKLPRREIDARIAETSTMLGLDAFLERYPKQLSGGQRQRVAMGRAIARRGAIFLFDEPLSNLDASLRSEVRVEIRRMHERLSTTTLYVTHDQVEAMTLADRLWVMNRGTIEQSGAPMAIYDRPRSLFVATFLGSPKMNTFEVTIESIGGAPFAVGDGFRVPVDVARFGVPASRNALIAGIRPHNLVLISPTKSVSSTSESAIRMRLELVEALGFEAFAYGVQPSSGARIVARVDPVAAAALRHGDELCFSASRSSVHLFSKATGLALDAAN